MKRGVYWFWPRACLGHGRASHQGAHSVDTPGPVREATARRGSAKRGLRGAVMLYTRSSRRLYCTPRTTSPPTRSPRLAKTRASCASARERRGSGAGFPTVDTAPPTPRHIPREFLVLHAAVHDGPASHSLRTPDHRQVGLREPQDHALHVPRTHDNLIVKETPAADVHIDDAEPGAFLDEMDGSALSIRMGRELARNALGLSAWYGVWCEWEGAGCSYTAFGKPIGSLNREPVKLLFCHVLWRHA